MGVTAGLSTVHPVSGILPLSMGVLELYALKEKPAPVQCLAKCDPPLAFVGGAPCTRHRRRRRRTRYRYHRWKNPPAQSCFPSFRGDLVAIVALRTPSPADGEWDQSLSSGVAWEVACPLGM